MPWTRWTAIVLSLIAVVTYTVAMSCATRQNQPAALTQEQKITRGEHLVGVTGCGDCHTPGSLFGGPDMQRKLSGSELGWTGPWGTTYARNLTPDNETGIGKWSEDDIVKAFRLGQRPDGSPLLPPMPWQDFAGFSDEDAYAIAAYLKSIPAVQHKVPDRLPPGVKAPVALVFPAPPAWDAPRADSTASH